MQGSGQCVLATEAGVWPNYGRRSSMNLTFRLRILVLSQLLLGAPPPRCAPEALGRIP